MKGTFTVACLTLLAGIVCFFSFSGRSDSAPQISSKPKSAFLIRFGLDGKAGVDWSGTVAAPGSRLQGWQFNTSDRIDGAAWKCATEREQYWDTPYEARMQPTSRREKVTQKGIRIEYEGNPPPDVQVSTSQGDFHFSTTIRPGDAPQLFLDGRASVNAEPAATPLTSGPDAEDYPSAIEAKDGTLWIAYQTWTAGGDQIFVRRMRESEWSEPEAIATAGGDYFRTAIAQDAAGRIWVVWAAQQNRNFDLYARSFDGKKWSNTERLTTAPNSDVFHTMVAGDSGHLYLAWQSARSGNFDIYLREFDGKKWGPETQVSSDPANDWEPALAAVPGGGVTIVWDTYARGNYDVVARTWRDGRLGPQFPIAQSGAFESRASAQYDRQGRLWVAWDEGDWNWGKDYGYEIPESGRGLLTRRQTRVAVLEQRQACGKPPARYRRCGSRRLAPGLSSSVSGAGWKWQSLGLLPNSCEPADQRIERKGPVPRVLASRSDHASQWPLDAHDGTSARLRPHRSRRWPSPAAPRADLAVVWVTDGRDLAARLSRRIRTWICIDSLGTAAKRSRRLGRPSASLRTICLRPIPKKPAISSVCAITVRPSAGAHWRVVRGDIHRHTDFPGMATATARWMTATATPWMPPDSTYLGVCDHLEAEPSDPVPLVARTKSR